MTFHSRALAAVAIAGAALGLAATPAAATRQPEVVVKEGPPFTKTYPAIVGQGGAQEQINWPTPAECSAPPGSAYCDVIPVTVQLPKDYDSDSDEYITRVSVAWDDSAGDNLDIFIYDMHQVQTGRSADANNPDATAKNPESSASADPKFQLVVLNVSGVNNGYKVTFTFTRRRFTPVAERPQSTGGVTEQTSPPQTTPRPTFAPTLGTPLPSLTPASPELPPLDLTDPDFSGDEGLASGIFTGERATAEKPQPPQIVSSAVLLIMLGAFPLAIALAGGLIFRRRASRLLRF